jgi:hypothetical protein
VGASEKEREQEEEGGAPVKIKKLVLTFRIVSSIAHRGRQKREAEKKWSLLIFLPEILILQVVC